MEFKGTNGKWVEYNGEIQNENEDFVCNCFLWESKEWESNALLISKAPEMLEMLQSFINDFDKGLIEDYQIPRDRFEQLIKEATEI